MVPGTGMKRVCFGLFCGNSGKRKLELIGINGELSVFRCFYLFSSHMACFWGRDMPRTTASGTPLVQALLAPSATRGTDIDGCDTVFGFRFPNSDFRFPNSDFRNPKDKGEGP